MGGYNSGFSSPQVEQAIAAALLQEKSSYNITQDKGQNYASLTEVIAAVSDEKYKVNGLVLTFYTGTEWVSKRYNGADASGFATEDNWVDAGGSIQETDWTPFNAIINRIIAKNYRNITDEEYNILKSFIKEPDKVYYPTVKSLESGQEVILQSSLCIFVSENSSDNIVGIINTGIDGNLNTYQISIDTSKTVDVYVFGTGIRVSGNDLTISAGSSTIYKQIELALSGDGTKFLSNNGRYKEISAGTQYLDFSMFVSERGTLSEEDYQKVVKAYEDKVNTAFLDTSIYPLSIQKSDNVYMLGVSFVSNDEMGHNFLTLSSILIVEKNYTQTSSSLFVIIDGSGTKALTDNGQYSEFASPIKTQDGGTGTVTKELQPNTFYKFEECSSLTITLAAEKSGILNEYMFEFVSGATATTLSIPQSVGWMGGKAPTIEANKTYQCSIVNNIAVIGGK